VAFRWSAGMLWATKWTTATMQAVAKRGGERERERERERVHRAEKLEESSRDQEALISNKY
jgi:hypothetical protein